MVSSIPSSFPTITQGKAIFAFSICAGAFATLVSLIARDKLLLIVSATGCAAGLLGLHVIKQLELSTQPGSEPKQQPENLNLQHTITVFEGALTALTAKVTGPVGKQLQDLIADFKQPPNDPSSLLTLLNRVPALIHLFAANLVPASDKQRKQNEGNGVTTYDVTTSWLGVENNGDTKK